MTPRDTANGAKRRGAHCKDAFNASKCLDLGMSHLLLLTALGLSFTSTLTVMTMSLWMGVELRGLEGG